MDIFVTGASGYIGQAVVRELLEHGHTVTGLARSDAGAARVEALGARVVRGAVEEPERLAAYAAQSEGVVHLAFSSDDMSDLGAGGRIDVRLIEAYGDALAGSDRPLVTTSGTLLVAEPGRVATEDVAVDLSTGLGAVRGPSEVATLALADRGVRSSLVRLAPSVHSDADSHGFVTTLIATAREKGFSGYLGDGTNRWPAVHRLDAARLFRLALEDAPAGTRLHGVGEEGVAFREIAEAIGRLTSLPVTSVDPADGAAHFGWMAAFAGLDDPTSSARTQQLLGWTPSGPTLVAEIDAGAYA